MWLDARPPISGPDWRRDEAVVAVRQRKIGRRHQRRARHREQIFLRATAIMWPRCLENNAPAAVRILIADKPPFSGERRGSESHRILVRIASRCRSELHQRNALPLEQAAAS